MSITPPDWAPYELDAMRLVLGFLLFRTVWLVGQRDVTTAPVGIARLTSLSRLTTEPTRRRSRWVFDAALLVFVSGWYLWASATIVAVLAVLWLTITCSKGTVNHGNHLTVIAICATALGNVTWQICDAFDAYPENLVLATPEWTGAWWAVQAIVAAYLVSGISKLALTQFRWIWRSPGLVVNAHIRAEVASGERGSSPTSIERSLSMAGLLGRHPWPARLVFGSGLFVELLSPLSLFNRATLVVGGAALLALHAANGALLRLRFVSYQWLLTVYLLQLPYLVVEGIDLIDPT